MWIDEPCDVAEEQNSVTVLMARGVIATKTMFLREELAQHFDDVLQAVRGEVMDTDDKIRLRVGQSTFLELARVTGEEIIDTLRKVVQTE